MKIKKGDKVIIMKGKDRGKSGKIVDVMPRDNKIVVEGLNVYKKTVKPRRQGEKGQIIDSPRPMNADNVQIVCSSCGKPTRIGVKVKNDAKERYCKKCNATI